jgi:hypothetical protein
MVDLGEVVRDFAEAFKAVDSAGYTMPPYRPGIGRFTESGAIRLALDHLRQVRPGIYQAAAPRKRCDLVIPGEWAIEFKVIRPFGDNGRPAEHWSENILHPYAGNVSAIGDCMKLLDSEFSERRAVLVYGFEHTPPQVPLETAVTSFEVIAGQVLGIKLGERQFAEFGDFIHPVHQLGIVYGWQVLGMERHS